MLVNIFTINEKLFSPFQNLYRGHSVAEFDMKWRHWKDECERRLEQNEFSLNKNLEDVARVISVKYYCY